MSGRPFDIVVWGATGYTGALIAEYLATAAPASVKWAIAGRARDKLDALRADLIRSSPALKDRLSVMTSNSEDQASLNALAESTRVLISAVGPFAFHGLPVVQACVEKRCDYVDVSGEAFFKRTCAQRFSDAAQRNGVLVVSGCAFDSIPSDLGTFMMAAHLRKAFGLPTRRVSAYISSSLLRPSGGTLQTVMMQLDAPIAVQRQLLDPYLLCTGPRGPDRTESYVPWRCAAPLRGWACYFPLSVLNSRVVRCSWSLLQQAQSASGYGPNFSYCEGTYAGSLLRAIVNTVLLVGAAFLLWFRPTRALLQWFVLPKPGQGPSRQQLKAGSLQMRFVAEADVPANQRAPVALGLVATDSDPSYAETAKMVSEAALCLVLERDSLPAKGGVLTPATAFGAILIARLRRAGMRFDVVERFTGV